jgi:hypothetical protein
MWIQPNRLNWRLRLARFRVATKLTKPAYRAGRGRGARMNFDLPHTEDAARKLTDRVEAERDQAVVLSKRVRGREE